MDGREQRASTLVPEAELKGGAVEQTAETAPSAGSFPQADQVKDKVDQASPLLSHSPNQTPAWDELERGECCPSLCSTKEGANVREQADDASGATAGTFEVKESCPPGCDLGAKSSAAASSPVKAATPPELGNWVRRDAELLKRLGWKKFVLQHRTKSDFTSLDRVNHPAKHLLKHYNSGKCRQV